MTPITAINKRAFDGTSGSIGHGPADHTLIDKLDALIDGYNAQLSGKAVVLNTASTVVVTVATGYQGKPVVAVMGEADGAVGVLSVVWTSVTQFTITLTAVTTADRDVYWMMDGRP